jgi:DNA replication and repair protein RecF
LLLTHLSLTNFRAFTRLDIEIPRRILLLVGDNAQGKTSLLEAIYFLATFSSFHTQTDRQLISFLASTESLAVTRITAQIEKAAITSKLEVRLIQENGGNGGWRLRKEILVDGTKRNIHESLGQLNAVIFLPQMMRILEGAPEDRRRYINSVISQIMPGYAQALSDYAKALEQRNALLKLLSERGGDASQLDYWDDLVSDRGSLLIHARILALQELEKFTAGIHQNLTKGREVLRLLYHPSYDPMPQPDGQIALPLKTPVDRIGFSIDEIKEGFKQKMSALRVEEIGRGVTTIGPHRDELRVLSNGIDLGDYGSRGQIRTALLAFKLAEVEWMKDKTGEYPVLLLDETLVELDSHRREDLLSYLKDYEQAILTTTDLNLFPPAFVDQCTLMDIAQGKISSRKS